MEDWQEIVYGLSNGTNASNLQWPWRSFIGCGLFKRNFSTICAVFYQISNESASRGPSATDGLLVLYILRYVHWHPMDANIKQWTLLAFTVQMQHTTYCFNPSVHIFFRVRSKVVYSLTTMVLRSQAKNVRVVLRVQLLKYFFALCEVNWASFPGLLMVAVKVLEECKALASDIRRQDRWLWTIQHKVTPAPLLQNATQKQIYVKQVYWARTVR